MGLSEMHGGNPLALLTDGTEDGCFLNEKTWGTYLHGIFDNQVVVKSLLKSCGKEIQSSEFDYLDYKNEQYDKLAEHIRKCCNLEYIYRTLKKSREMTTFE